MVAHHYTEANLTEQAIPYWLHAGQHALKRSANVEAERHLTSGLAQLTTLPDTPARAQQELAFQLALGPVLAATKGLGAVEGQRAYTRARELCEQTGETSRLVPVLLGLVRCYGHQGEVKNM